MSAQQCEWFAGFTNDATGVVEHPVLGQVPTCQMCADKLGLELQPAVFVPIEVDTSKFEERLSKLEDRFESMLEVNSLWDGS